MRNKFIPSRQSTALLTLILGLFVVGLSFLASSAHAAGIQDLSSDWQKQITSLVDVAGMISLLAGIFIGFSGVLMLKQYADEGNRIDIKQPLMRIVVAVMLVALPLTLGTGVGSIFGSGDTMKASGTSSGLGSITAK